MKLLTMLAASCGSALVLVVLAPAAFAVPPDQTPVTVTQTTTLTGACAFPITVTSTLSFIDREFYDQSGALVMESANVQDQDTFTANGKTLTGTPFTYYLRADYDLSGNMIDFYADGVMEKVQLPDGSHFLSAGRVNFTAHGTPGFLLTPDSGATVNLAGFCAALAP